MKEETKMMTDQVKSREKIEKDQKEKLNPNKIMSELLGIHEDKNIPFNPNRY